jgi:hypothetical protein
VLVEKRSFLRTRSLEVVVACWARAQVNVMLAGFPSFGRPELVMLSCQARSGTIGPAREKKPMDPYRFVEKSRVWVAKCCGQMRYSIFQAHEGQSRHPLFVSPVVVGRSRNRLKVEDPLEMKK